MLRQLNTLTCKEIERRGFITVAIEGNIGSGKSTFLSQFTRNKMIDIVEEPVAKWQGVSGYNLLQLMYEDPKKWGFCFQTQVQLTMLQNHVRSTQQPIKMMERSLHSARHCFVENLFRSGLMCSEQMSVLDAWYKWLCQQDSVHVDLFVYLKTSPEVVRERVVARGRKEEVNAVDLNFLQRIHDLHETWLSSDNLNAPVLVVDGNKTLSDMKNEHFRINSTITELIKDTNRQVSYRSK